jgi:hypothetical protein
MCRLIDSIRSVEIILSMSSDYLRRDRIQPPAGLFSGTFFEA